MSLPSRPPRHKPHDATVVSSALRLHDRGWLPVQGLSAAGERYIRGKDDLSMDLNDRLGKWSASPKHPTTADRWLLKSRHRLWAPLQASRART